MVSDEEFRSLEDRVAHLLMALRETQLEQVRELAGLREEMQHELGGVRQEMGGLRQEMRAGFSTIAELIGRLMPPGEPTPDPSSP